MKEWLVSPRGAVWLSLLTLLSHVWRGFLDAMFVWPVDFKTAWMMQLAAMIYTLLFAGWTWAIFAAWQGSRRGLIAASLINALVLLVVPVGWLLFYCPATCRANAGVFNLANALNLLLGLLVAIALGLQWRQVPRITAASRG